VRRTADRDGGVMFGATFVAVLTTALLATYGAMLVIVLT